MQKGAMEPGGNGKAGRRSGNLLQRHGWENLAVDRLFKIKV